MPQPPSLAIDDPQKIVKVVGQDGKSGDQKEIAYTNCKVVGNGSFGVVFSAKLVKPGQSASFPFNLLGVRRWV